MKRKTTEIVDATIQLYVDLQKVIGLTSRVLAKFPAETVPQILKPFLGSPRVAFARPSMTGDGKIMLQLDRRTQPYVMAWIPVEWLTMHESQLASAVREVYWSDKAERAHRELIRLGKMIGEHNRQAEDHRRKATEIRRERDRLAASIRRRSARKRSAVKGDSDA